MSTNKRNLLRNIFLEAWRLKKRTFLWSYSFGIALKIAWKTVRNMVRFISSKVRGVSFENRQQLLQRLSVYDTKEIMLYFNRQHNNPVDSYAIQVIAEVRSKGMAAIGYLSRDLAANVAPLLDEGRTAIVLFDCITGGGSKSFGCNFRFVIM